MLEIEVEVFPGDAFCTGRWGKVSAEVEVSWIFCTTEVMLGWHRAVG